MRTRNIYALTLKTEVEAEDEDDAEAGAEAGVETGEHETQLVFNFTFWRDIAVEFIASSILICVQTVLAINWSAAHTTQATSGETLQDIVNSNTTANFLTPESVLFQSSMGTWLIVTSLVWTFQQFGGCMMNPAITLAFVVCCRITIHRGIWYAIVQLAAGLISAFSINASLPLMTSVTLHYNGYQYPYINQHPGLCFAIEAIITCQLTLVYLVTLSSKSNRAVGCVVIGMSSALGVLIASSFTGGVTGFMNPARSLAIHYLSNDIDRQLEYFLGPLCGAVIATLIYLAIRGCRLQSGMMYSDDVSSYCRGRRALRIRNQLIQYHAAIYSPDGDTSYPLLGQSSAGGPPICYPCDEITSKRNSPNNKYEGVVWL